MSGVWAVARREGSALFSSPIAWVVATAFLLWSGFSFRGLVESYALAGHAALAEGGVPHQSLEEAVTAPLAVGLAFALILFVPFLAMRLLAEERRSGSEELLLTLPIRDWEVVLGKYLATLGAIALFLVPTLLYPAVLAREIPLAWGQIGAAYLGLLLAGAAYLALGLWASSRTENQILAAVTSLTLLLLLFFLDRILVGESGEVPFAAKLFSLSAACERFARGIVSVKDVVLHVVLCVWFLLLAVQALGARRARA